MIFKIKVGYVVIQYTQHVREPKFFKCSSFAKGYNGICTAEHFRVPLRRSRYFQVKQLPRNNLEKNSKVRLLITVMFSLRTFVLLLCCYEIICLAQNDPGILIKVRNRVRNRLETGGESSLPISRKNVLRHLRKLNFKI